MPKHSVHRNLIEEKSGLSAAHTSRLMRRANSNALKNVLSTSGEMAATELANEVGLLRAVLKY